MTPHFTPHPVPIPFYIAAMSSASANGQHKLGEEQVGVAVGTVPTPPKFTSKEQEREYLKFRLAQAFRLFGQMLRLYLTFHIVYSHLVPARHRQARLR